MYYFFIYDNNRLSANQEIFTLKKKPFNFLTIKKIFVARTRKL